MSRHDWSKTCLFSYAAGGACLKCGLTAQERINLTGELTNQLFPDLHHCTGNAYICRVASLDALRTT